MTQSLCPYGLRRGLALGCAAGMLLIAVMGAWLQGCSDCCNTPRPNTDYVGTVTIQITNLPALVPKGPKQYLSVAYAGTCTRQDSDKGVAAFAASRSYEVTDASVNPAPMITWPNLRPGAWHFTASIGNRQAAADGTITKGGNLTVQLTF